MFPHLFWNIDFPHVFWLYISNCVFPTSMWLSHLTLLDTTLSTQNTRHQLHQSLPSLSWVSGHQWLWPSNTAKIKCFATVLQSSLSNPCHLVRFCQWHIFRGTQEGVYPHDQPPQLKTITLKQITSLFH